ncbi:hypothetical protein E0T54_RS12580 [Enterococcus hirae]
MALSAEQRKTKEIAKAILEANGQEYDTALDRFHQEIISENQELILNSLKQSKSKQLQKGQFNEKESNQFQKGDSNEKESNESFRKMDKN